MFGNNDKSVVNSSKQWNTKLHKHHYMLSIHHSIGEVTTAGILGLYFITGDDNPADILNKHWGYTQINDRQKSVLIWKGDTVDIKMVPEE
jgi:hypothetical protein